MMMMMTSDDGDDHYEMMYNMTELKAEVCHTWAKHPTQQELSFDFVFGTKQLVLLLPTHPPTHPISTEMTCSLSPV